MLQEISTNALLTRKYLEAETHSSDWNKCIQLTHRRNPEKKSLLLHMLKEVQNYGWSHLCGQCYAKFFMVGFGLAKLPFCCVLVSAFSEIILQLLFFFVHATFSNCNHVDC